MARYRKRDALELRVANEVHAGGKRYTADLIAKRATGVQGYRMTVAFLEVDGPDSAFVDLEPAPTREEARQRAEKLAERPSELEGLIAGRTGAAADGT